MRYFGEDEDISLLHSDFYSILQVVFFWILIVRQIMQFYDSNPDKRPNLPPNVKRMSQSSIQLSEKEQEQIKEVFDLFDTDGGNTIDSDELDAAMFAMGFQPNGLSNKVRGRNSFSFSRKKQDEDLVQMDHIDADGSKTITLEEFTALMKGELTSRGPLEEIWGAFSLMSQGSTATGSGANQRSISTDIQLQASARRRSSLGGMDEWGSVTLDGLQLACKEFNVKMTAEELKYMIKEIDLDNSGSIDRDEFMQIMDAAPWF